MKLFQNKKLSRAWWYTPVNPAFGKRTEDGEFKTTQQDPFSKNKIKLKNKYWMGASGSHL
jgi:hypothetical protein